MAWDGAPTVGELASAGVVRISLGSAVAQAAYAVAARATRELLADGTYGFTADGIPYDQTNDALASGPATQKAR
jgi:2-methylisocitrate lyase-like PEP mutase family enzyme